MAGKVDSYTDTSGITHEVFTIQGSGESEQDWRDRRNSILALIQVDFEPDGNGVSTEEYIGVGEKILANWRSSNQPYSYEEPLGSSGWSQTALDYIDGVNAETAVHPPD